MRELNIGTIEELRDLFKNGTEEITDNIVEAISEAFQFQKDAAHIFTINFEDSDIAYDISLGSDQWVTSITKCLDNYHNLESSDKAIDTYLLLKDIKKWLENK